MFHANKLKVWFFHLLPMAGESHPIQRLRLGSSFLAKIIGEKRPCRKISQTENFPVTCGTEKAGYKKSISGSWNSFDFSYIFKLQKCVCANVLLFTTQNESGGRRPTRFERNKRGFFPQTLCENRPFLFGEYHQPYGTSRNYFFPMHSSHCYSLYLYSCTHIYSYKILPSFRHCKQDCIYFEASFFIPEF